MVGGEAKDRLSKYATSLDLTHSRVGQIFIKGPTLSLWVFAVELGAGVGDLGCRQASRLSTCGAALLAGRPPFFRVPDFSLSWLWSAFSSLRAAYKHHVPVFIWNYSTVKCTLLAKCDTRECGNPHSFVYSTNMC